MPFPIPQELGDLAQFLARPNKAELVGQTFVSSIELAGKHFRFVCPTTSTFTIGSFLGRDQIHVTQHNFKENTAMNSISPSSAAALSNLITVSEKGDVPMTTSLNVAEIFGKMHKNVLQAIENLGCSKEFKDANFQPCAYETKSGFGYRKFPMYRLTRNGFVLLVMGFTGAKALQFKLWYIAEFNRMEAVLRDLQRNALISGYSNPVEAARAWADQFEKRQALEAWSVASAKSIEAEQCLMKVGSSLEE